MNRKLSHARIRSTCRELLKKEGAVSGRRLCAELRARFGVVGKTEIVFSIWREEVGAVQASAASIDVAELKRQLAAAEAAAAENLARAERAELREEAHQDKWAMEVDGLRQEIKLRKSNAAEVRVLTERVLTLSRELMAARAGR